VGGVVGNELEVVDEVMRDKLAVVDEVVEVETLAPEDAAVVVLVESKYAGFSV